MTDRARTLRAWLLAMSRLEISLRTQQGRARNAMIRRAAKAYQETGQVPAFVLGDHRMRTRRVLEDHYRRTIPVFSQMALRGIKSRQIEQKQIQTIYEALIAQWINREALKQATLIADTDRDDVTTAIETGMAEGLGVEQIARNIRKVSAQTPWRAAVIARTETHNAATFGSIESVRQAEDELGVVMIKEWLATKDSRTRPEHSSADGQKVALNEKFTVGGELMDRPGDSSASAANVVHCRCAIVYEEKEE